MKKKKKEKGGAEKKKTMARTFVPFHLLNQNSLNSQVGLVPVLSLLNSGFVWWWWFLLSIKATVSSLSMIEGTTCWGAPIPLFHISRYPGFVRLIHAYACLQAH